MAVVESTLRRKLELMHGARPELIRRTRVQERLNRRSRREYEVLVFELIGHPDARFCYAWEADGRVVTVLGLPPVRSALDAIQSRYRDRNIPVFRRRLLACSPRRRRSGAVCAATPGQPQPQRQPGR